MQIHWRHPNVLPLERQLAAERQIEALADGHRDLIDVWIELEKSRHHRSGEDRAKIRCMARNTELVAETLADDISSALQACLTDFEREVRRYRERRESRRKRRPAPPPHLGIVDKLFPDEGYGFLLTQGGEQVYFHRNALDDQLSFDALELGQSVALAIENGDRGLQATFVAAPPPSPPKP